MEVDRKGLQSGFHVPARVCDGSIQQSPAGGSIISGMARITYTNSESLSVDVDGQTYYGTLTTKGAQEVRMTVEYKGKEISDGRKWGTDAEEDHNMRAIAQSLLLQMVHDDIRKSQRSS